MNVKRKVFWGEQLADGNLFLAVVVPDEKGHTDDGQQKLKSYDENVCHDGDFYWLQVW